MTDIAAYGTWRSPITAELVTAAQVGLGQPGLDRGLVYWAEARPQEAGRVALVRHGPEGRADATPPGFNVRTRVHEYGGGAWLVRDGVLVAIDFADQRLYRLSPGTSPTPLTPGSDRKLRYADLEPDLGRRRILAVREDHRGDGEPVNSIVALGLDGPGEGRVLVDGHDFFSAPRLSPDGRRLAWLSWDHPDMPWDGTRLWSAEIRDDGGLAQVRLAAGGDRESVVQPEWSPAGELYFVSDRSGWWNLYRASDNGAIPVCPMSAEFAGPAWTFGSRWYAFLGPKTILACFTEDGSWHLGRIEVGEGRLTRLDLPSTSLGGIATAAGRAVLRAGGPDRPAAIIEVDAASGTARELCTAGEVPADARFLARPEPFAFASGGAIAHAFYYPPTSPAFTAPAGERPPLIVKSHGGPTGATSSELRLSNQFWTSRGFALCDVNYGGSTGYGRAYRERLNGRWGEIDVEDCLNAARHLVAAGMADAGRLAITGGSAGGYTTLCALTFHDLFKAGSSHYGVSDLEALAKDTHKFESRYLDRLVGPYPEAAELYRARSPIRHVDRLSCPIIFFQGLEDAVVPPNQAETMVEALRSKGVPVAYMAFEGEQHGFRRSGTIETVLRAELAFYGRIFGFEPADGLADLAIENLLPPVPAPPRGAAG
ncbi:MAG TPA: S9 family peptidase [Geminicoccaceae bacterium]|nr:S9 family peptidase [Geminicoccaceae bacterium]